MFVERVLVAAACDDSSLVAVRFAIRLAEALGAELAAVAVLDEIALADLVACRVFVEKEAQEYARDIAEEGERFLGRVAGMAASRGVKCRTHMLKGAVHRAVLEAAAQFSAHLLVIGEVEQQSGRRDGWLSPGQRILHGARCPVLVVKNTHLVERMCGEVRP